MRVLTLILKKDIIGLEGLSVRNIVVLFCSLCGFFDQKAQMWDCFYGVDYWFLQHFWGKTVICSLDGRTNSSFFAEKMIDLACFTLFAWWYNQGQNRLKCPFFANANRVRLLCYFQRFALWEKEKYWIKKKKAERRF